MSTPYVTDRNKERKRTLDEPFVFVRLMGHIQISLRVSGEGT